MIPPLVGLPATVLVAGDISVLARCASVLCEGRTVVLGEQRTASGEVLDEFVVASAIAAMLPACSIGVIARVGAGRPGSVIAREATAAQLLGACDVLVLDGDAAACSDAAVIIEALFTPGTHVVASGVERVDGARNLPQPSVEGGPRIAWRAGDELWGIDAGAPVRIGDVITVGPDVPLPEPAADTLVMISYLLAPPSFLDDMLRR